MYGFKIIKTLNKKITILENSSNFEINGIKGNVPVGGIHFVYNATCAFAIGDILNVEKEKIIKGISEFKLTAKRMEIETIKNNIKVINDSYNASYDSMKAALEVMQNTEAPRKIAILGDMLELGEYSKELHEKVGEQVVKNKIDVLITIGKNAKNISNKARELGMDTIYVFDSVNEAILNIEKIIKSKDLVLLKASNSMNFSKILDELKRS